MRGLVGGKLVSREIVREVGGELVREDISGVIIS